MSGALLRNNSQDNLTHRLLSAQVVSLLTTLHDPNLRPGVKKHEPSSTESFLAVDTTPVESVALVPALVTLSYLCGNQTVS